MRQTLTPVSPVTASSNVIMIKRSHVYAQYINGTLAQTTSQRDEKARHLEDALSKLMFVEEKERLILTLYRRD